MPSNLLGPLITFKIRHKLLLRFFLNHNLSGYLHGLTKELDENTNSVNIAHPRTTDLSNMLLQVTGIYQLVEREVTLVGEALDKNYLDGLMIKLESLIKRPSTAKYATVMWK